MSQPQPSAEAANSRGKYRLAIVLLGIVPNWLMLGLGSFAVMNLVSPSYRAILYHVPRELVAIVLICAVYPALNLWALRRKEHGGKTALRMLAGLSCLAMLLFSIWLAREEFQGGHFRLEPPLVFLPALALSGLVALVLSHLASQERPTFTLWQLGLAVTVLALFLAVVRLIVVPDDMHDYRRQREIAREIEAEGGTTSWHDWQIVMVQYGASLTPPTPEHLETLADLPKLGVLNLEVANVTDQHLQHLAGARSLQLLWLNNTAITDQGLEGLVSLNQLRELSLDRTSITDAGLDSLAELKSLEVLSLKDTQVTRAGADRLSRELPNTKIYGTNRDGSTFQILP